MREIKLKAVTKEGELIDVHSIDFMEDGLYYVNDEYMVRELIQSTNLKDRNGIEIYEGYILRDIDRRQRERWQGPVVWQISGFVVAYRNLRNKTWTKLTELVEPNLLHWEVIGNIYENPELLERKPR